MVVSDTAARAPAASASTAPAASISSGAGSNAQASTGQERSLSSLLSDLSALEGLQSTWPEEQQRVAQAHGAAIDALNAAAFRALIRRLQGVAGTAAALREAASDELVYTVLRRHGILKPSLHEQVDQALDSIRPALASHGGDVELVEVDKTSVKVRFLGACDGCPASALTFYGGVQKAIQDKFPQITDITHVKGRERDQNLNFTSPFAAFETEGWTCAIALDHLADGQTQVREVGGESILLTRFGDRVTCFKNACAHMGLALDDGDITEGVITCPYHGFQYSLKSGECLTAPEVNLHPYGVRVKDGQVDVRLTR